MQQVQEFVQKYGSVGKQATKHRRVHPEHKKFKVLRDHNGEIMTHKAIRLSKSNLYQRGAYMQPVTMSASLKIDKDVIADLYRRKLEARKLELMVGTNGNGL